MYTPDDAILVEVTASTLSTNRFFEGYHHAGNVMSIPRGSKNSVRKSCENKNQRFKTLYEGKKLEIKSYANLSDIPQSNQVLHQLLSQIMIDAIYFLLFEQAIQMFGKFSRSLKIPSERLF